MVWLHSAAAPFAPLSTRPSITMPPPTPVPSVAPNTTSGARGRARPARAAAPSVASDSTKQLASLSTRTGRPATRQILVDRLAVE